MQSIYSGDEPLSPSSSPYWVSFSPLLSRASSEHPFLRPGLRFSLRPTCTLCKGSGYIASSLLQRSEDKKLLRLTEAAIQRSFSMQWVVATAAFFASAVEFVEAFTIVLVVGVTVNWRSALLGALAAAATLALLVATLGVAVQRNCFCRPRRAPCRPAGHPGRRFLARTTVKSTRKFAEVRRRDHVDDLWHLLDG